MQDRFCDSRDVSDRLGSGEYSKGTCFSLSFFFVHSLFSAERHLSRAKPSDLYTWLSSRTLSTNQDNKSAFQQMQSPHEIEFCGLCEA